MTNPPLTSDQVSQLIDHLLTSKDPVTAGLSRILKRKTDEGRNFPVKPFSLEQFSESEGKQGVFEKNEIELLKREKLIQQLRLQIETEKKKAQAAIQAAYNKGKTEGEAAGRAAGKADAEKEYEGRIVEVTNRFQSMLAEVRTAKEQYLTGARRMLLELSMAIARKIVAAEISLNPDIVLEVIKKALAYIHERERLVVRVAAGDFENVTGKKEFWASVADRLDGIKIEADPRIEQGGCIIESASGVADARTGVLFDEIRDVIDTTWESLLSSGQIHTSVQPQPSKEDAAGRQSPVAQAGGTAHQ